MKLSDKVIIVTGAAQGIGRALCERFADEGPRAIVLADIDFDTVTQVADAVTGDAHCCDVSKEPDIQQLVETTIRKYDRIDLFCSNAGIALPGGVDTPDDRWRHILDVNFMSHVYAARAVLPHMLDRGEGYLLQTASAAGLLTQIGSAPYAVSKHAAVSFAEWLSVTYGDRGIKVSCLCPQGVSTRMLQSDDPAIRMLHDNALSPEQVAESVVDGLQTEQFLILPHPEVARYFQNKASDYDRWLKGMRRLQQQMATENQVD